jgi:hypothetical protein
MSEKNDSIQYPIVTYTNRIQKQLEFVTEALGFYSIRGYSLSSVISQLRMIYRNLPPKAKEDLAFDYKNLKDYMQNTSAIPTVKEAEEIYDRLHDWLYDNLLQDAFKFRPRNPNEAHIGGGKKNE